jgi:hypothetical protein
LRGLGDGRVYGLQTGDRITQDGQERVHHQRDDRRQVTEAEDRYKNTEQREGGDGQENRGDRQHHVRDPLPAVHQHTQANPDRHGDGQRYGDDQSVPYGQLEHVIPTVGHVFEEVNAPPFPTF